MQKRIFCSKSTTYHLPSTNSGFTIVELIVVVAVIAILSAIFTVSYNSAIQNSIKSSLQSGLKNASKQLNVDQIRSSTGVFPATLAAANSGTGISFSPSTTVVYNVDNADTPKTFCLTATQSGQSYFITQEGTPLPGPCPVLYLDASIPTSYPGTGTAWNDLSGLGNNGTLYNGVGYSSTNGGALTFDGVDDYVIIADTASLKPANQISYSFWVKPTTFSGWNCVFGKYNSPRVQFGGGKLYMDDFPSANIPAGGEIISNSTFLINNWYFIIYIYDGNSLALYVNGTLDKSLSSFNGVFSWNNNNYTIGTPAYLPYGFVNFLYGQISNFQIYKRAITSTEITQNFNTLRGRYGL